MLYFKVLFSQNISCHFKLQSDQTLLENFVNLYWNC